MNDYLSANRQVYDATALEFDTKQEQRLQGTEKLVDWLLGDAEPGESFDVLELGPGAGIASKLMGQRGHRVTAIEFSQPMAELAARTAPAAQIIHDEFLSHDFGDKTYDAIFAVAFVHLFPYDDAVRVMHKINDLLRPGGRALVSTTEHAQTSEDYLTKINFKSSLKRFRRLYDRPHFEDLLTASGLQTAALYVNHDPVEPDKTWMNAIVSKNNEIQESN